MSSDVMLPTHEVSLELLKEVLCQWLCANVSKLICCWYVPDADESIYNMLSEVMKFCIDVLHARLNLWQPE